MAIIPALIPVISEVTLQAVVASVSLTVPSGYEILFLEMSNIYGDSIDNQTLHLTFNSDTGNNYDYSKEGFGSASSTTNGMASIDLTYFGNTDSQAARLRLSVVIFNRDGAEKVVMGKLARVNYLGASTNKPIGSHIEGKWRTTSGVITTLTLTPSTGNFAAGSKFILRGLRTDKAPHLGSKDIVQFIGSVDVASGSSVVLPTIPKGYGMLWLFWSDIYGDSNSLDALTYLFNNDSGNNYDYSYPQFSSASVTANAESVGVLSRFADADGRQVHSTGFMTIFNRSAQEKVGIGVNVDIDKGNGNAEDLVGLHLENKWRNTSDEISTVTLEASVGNFAGSGKAWLLGVKI